MHKRQFNILFVWMVLLLLLFIVYRILTVEPRNAETLKALSEQRDKSQSEALSTTQEVQPLSDELIALLAELEPHQYHEDPFIEARTVQGLLFMCSREFGLDQEIWQQFAKNLPAKDISAYMTMCGDMLLRYPTLLGSADSYQLSQSIPATSESGRKLQVNFLPMDPMNSQLFSVNEKNRLYAALRAENSVFLSEMALASFLYFQQGEVLPVSRWLQSQDFEYNRMVTSHALFNIACRYQEGSICEPIGMVSWMLCINDKDLCGKDYAHIYATTVMPGMQQDVAIVIAELEQWRGSD